VCQFLQRSALRAASGGLFLLRRVRAGGRPIRRPWALARLRPSAVRVRIRSRSTSARPPNTASIKRPVLAPVSAHGSASGRNCAFASAICLTMAADDSRRRCRRARPVNRVVASITVKLDPRRDGSDPIQTPDADRQAPTARLELRQGVQEIGSARLRYLGVAFPTCEFEDQEKDPAGGNVPLPLMYTSPITSRRSLLVISVGVANLFQSMAAPFLGAE
jgi:hypothetical protein